MPANGAVSRQLPQSVHWLGWRKVLLGGAIISGLSASPRLLSDDRRTSDFLWYFSFNRALDINELRLSVRDQGRLARGSAADARDFYIEILRRVPV